MLAGDYQKWLNAQGAELVVDGHPGALTREATKAVFSNLNAPAVSRDVVEAIANDLSCDVNQLIAVANVESSGQGFDKLGRPKILFERHKFSNFTGHKYDICDYSNPLAGGYDVDSWEKLTHALCADVDAAFQSASWGKFQIMGMWFADLGYTSALEMAWSTTESEEAHYQLFSAYISLCGLEDALLAVSTNPNDCRPFAKGFNGGDYAAKNYHGKIAGEMQRLEAGDN